MRMYDSRNLLFFEELPDSDSNILDTSETPVSGEDVIESDPALEETETEQESVLEVTFPSDYLDVDTFNAGVDSILDAVMPEVEEEPLSLFSVRASGGEFPNTAVYVLYNGQQVLFPSDYADDLYIMGDELCNTGSSVTVGMNLSSSASVNNYIISEVTIPIYNSGTYWQYKATYGAPYRIVDRYTNSNGSYSSVTRSTSTVLDFTEAQLSGWRGFNQFDFTVLAIGFVLIGLAIIARFRRLTV